VKIAGEYRISAGRASVWAALNDPDMLSRCIPGCESLEKISDTELKARIKAAIGPVRATFNTRLTLDNLNPPESYTLVGDSKAGAAGFGRGSADVFLIEEGSITVLRYDADFKVGGKLAQVGSRLVAGATKKTADDFFGKFSTELDPGARRIEIEEGIEVEEEEGIEAAEAAMMLSRIGKIAAFVILVLLIAWFLLG
jgi:carbon monoxide dehydrogenase subunit G